MDVLAAPVESPVFTMPSFQGQAKTRAEMESAAKEFEEVFMGLMLKPMWEGIETDPVFGGGAGEDVMRDLLIMEYGKAMAQADNFGLSKAVLNEMIRIQENADAVSGKGETL